MTQQKNNDNGIASLILGIGSIVLGWIPVLGLALGVLAIIFYSQQKKINPDDFAIAGLVTGIIGLAISLIYNLLWFFLGEMLIHL